MTLSIGLIGAFGRMGKKTSSCISKDPSLNLIWEIGKQESRINLRKVDVIIDFSSPSALKENLLLAECLSVPIVIGTTGFLDEHKNSLTQAACNIPVFWAANFSLGMAALTYAVEKLSAFFQNSFSASISETHHIHKKDKPSGSALSLQSAIQTGCFQKIPIESLREKEVIGEHSVFFVSEYEKVTLKHESLCRDTFSLGAIRAAKFLAKMPNGLYQMQDLISSSLEIPFLDLQAADPVSY